MHRLIVTVFSGLTVIVFLQKNSPIRNVILMSPKGHSARAEDKTDELKQLNRSIFRPVITFNKDAKRAAQEAKLQARYEEDRDEREKAMMGHSRHAKSAWARHYLWSGGR